MPGDSVLKILMQKVRSLDLNLSVLEQYLEELNSRYGKIFKEFDKEMGDKDALLKKIQSDMRSIFDSNEVLTKEVGDLIAWKSLVSVQLDSILSDNSVLRLDVAKVRENQIHMDNKGIVIFLICLICGLLALVRLFMDMVFSVYKSETSRKFCSTDSSWLFLLLSCHPRFTYLPTSMSENCDSDSSSCDPSFLAVVFSALAFYSDQPPSCCPTASAELKLYQAFIFSVPIFFTFILLLLFYLLYLRRRRVDWSSLGMLTSLQTRDDISVQSELGVKKELREMLPIIVFKESFSVRDTQCSVCLGEYQAEDRLQQIPACGHTFHMDCIDHWLARHTTCPLCRLSILASAKAATETPDSQAETSRRNSNAENGGEISLQIIPQYCEDPQTSLQSSRVVEQ
ncbi:hypothetical protein F0562_011729 [Nyssa sinensis]|uniref:RING-type E3 ubiquitin transferase n=1 Tax=Nyssa sinensis TaxID=561372 RepID=A0A5J4ZTY5_9ASTE|nr:hypothetical protein F0562_011729 [Nyssa sinensis]